MRNKQILLENKGNSTLQAEVVAEGVERHTDAWNWRQVQVINNPEHGGGHQKKRDKKYGDILLRYQGMTETNYLVKWKNFFFSLDFCKIINGILSNDYSGREA